MPCSALAECFLKKLREQGFIHYIDGEEAIYTKEDEDAQGSLFGAKPLIPLDEKVFFSFTKQLSIEALCSHCHPLRPCRREPDWKKFRIQFNLDLEGLE